MCVMYCNETTLCQQKHDQQPEATDNKLDCNHRRRKFIFRVEAVVNFGNI